MALPHPLPNLTDTLAYFDKYDYPLTWEEIKYWSHTTSASGTPSYVGGGRRVVYKNGFYFFKNRSKLVKLRKQRAGFSQKKWLIAKQVGEKLQKFPFIVAIFVTGALAMNNCPKDDDIDLMIITKSNTLWLTRFFVNLYLWRLRRFPSQTTAPDKICPNLWLDSNHLSSRYTVMHNHSIYIAHEILQAKCIFDCGGIHYQFLKQNSWVKKYLPVAFKSQIQNSKVQINSKSQFPNTNLVIRIFNLVLFIVQWLYMKPKMTTERVSLGYAFFHPAKSL